jgi:hypothetical protein
VRLAVRRSHGFLEDVFETFVREVAFLVGDPFLQPKMRLDDELEIDEYPKRDQGSNPLPSSGESGTNRCPR